MFIFILNLPRKELWGFCCCYFGLSLLYFRVFFLFFLSQDLRLASKLLYSRWYIWVILSQPPEGWIIGLPKHAQAGLNFWHLSLAITRLQGCDQSYLLHHYISSYQAVTPSLSAPLSDDTHTIRVQHSTSQGLMNSQVPADVQDSAMVHKVSLRFHEVTPWETLGKVIPKARLWNSSFDFQSFLGHQVYGQVLFLALGA